MDLDEGRDTIADLDDAVVEAIAERLQAARRVGQAKQEAGVAIRDFEREAEVLDRVRGRAEALDVPPGIVEEIFETLIEASLHVQEEVHTHAQYTAGERTAAVVGGAGKMGRWFASFLSAQGYQVRVEDPEGPPDGFEALGGLDGALDVDLVVVSVPIDATRDVLDGLREAEGLVLDIASIKAPFADRLREMAKTGAVASIHPLWGPATRTLAGRNLLVMDCGDEAAVEQAIDLFEGTLARPIVLPLEDHDAAMATTLGLSHAVNIVFADLLRSSGRDLSGFAARGDSTFLRQARLARSVVAEDPGLYHDIQALNPHMEETYEALGAALDRVVDAVGTPERFAEIMERSNAFMEAYDWSRS